VSYRMATSFSCLLAFVAAIHVANVRAADEKAELVGVVFNGSGRYGDFKWMIEQISYRDALFVFNDNEAQYKEHRDHPADSNASGCAQGGGNAIIRPYQCRKPARAAGIPTGPRYDALTPATAQIIDEAVENIVGIVNREKYRRVFYSAADESGNLGTSIFHPGDDVKRYIVQRLKLRLERTSN
jgi:hypothetical protein